MNEKQYAYVETVDSFQYWGETYYINSEGELKDANGDILYCSELFIIDNEYARLYIDGFKNGIKTGKRIGEKEKQAEIKKLLGLEE